MKLVVVATYPTAHDAELDKVRLEQAGIQTFVDGSAAADTLSLGTFLGGVKLLVSDTDVAKARTALSKADDDESTTPAWTCSECGTDIEAGYEVCWSCGHTIDGEETFPEEPQLTGETETIDCPMCGDSYSAPPYQCPSCGEVARDVEAEVETTDSSTEPLEPEVDGPENDAAKLLMRGWRSAVIASVLWVALPYVLALIVTLLHIFSMKQLFRYIAACDANNASTNWRAWFGILLDIAGLVLSVPVVLAVLRSVLSVLRITLRSI